MRLFRFDPEGDAYEVLAWETEAVPRAWLVHRHHARERAEDEARTIVQKAEAEAAEIRARAEQASASERERVLEEERARFHAEVSATLVRLSALESSLERTVQKKVASLATLVAERLILSELETREDAVEKLVLSVLEEAREKRAISVRLAARDFARLQATALFPRGVRVQEDEALSSGDVIVETESGLMEAPLRTRLSFLEEALLRMVPEVEGP